METLKRWICDEILENVFQYLDSPADRAAISEVSKQWHRIEGLTRKSTVVGFSYAVHPSSLSRRFRNLEALIVKGKPRVCEFGLLQINWGGYADPWLWELHDMKERTGSFSALSSIHLRRLEVSDDALAALAEGFSSSLEVLKLDKCSGFSTVGLHAIARFCRNLRILYLNESLVEDAGGEWLHELAENHTRLEVLNFSLTGLEVEHLEDLAAILGNCKSLTSLKLGEILASNADISNMRGILTASKSLKELVLLYRSVDDSIINQQFDLPRTLTSLAGDIPVPLDPVLASGLVKLDLMVTTLDAEAHYALIKCCPNLEELKVRNLIGDEGLDIVASCCKKMKRIRIENLEDQHGFVSHKGLISLASSCINLQFIAIYTSDLTNSALQAFAKFCPQLYDFRIAVLDSAHPLTELPLDVGVKALLQGCQKLTRLAVYLRLGGLSDQGLAEIGKLAGNLKWLLLGCVGYSDRGFIDFASGCHSLLKLELRHCPFSEAAIATGVRKMKCLKYIWSQGYRQIDTNDLLIMGPSWNIEHVPSLEESDTQFVAYRSLSGPRCDCPPEVISLVS